MQVTHRADGAVIMNDAFNANPHSMRAALDSLRLLRAERRVAVLGAMLDRPGLRGGARGGRPLRRRPRPC
ncbi:glutamate ligase domain-containing protein [Marinactinospora rubrisoli]|uniref:Glutamate ligase domain-containing protein n=1 Tax=Marinactinospora rubrisoli TaxID=2715399 RepID=A0ABW2KHZ1_9ACTN